MQKVALTRDWFGRTNPNSYPTHGFFPVWPLLLVTLAGANNEKIQYFESKIFLKIFY